MQIRSILAIILWTLPLTAASNIVDIKSRQKLFNIVEATISYLENRYDTPIQYHHNLQVILLTHEEIQQRWCGTKYENDIKKYNWKHNSFLKIRKYENCGKFNSIYDFWFIIFLLGGHLWGLPPPPGAKKNVSGAHKLNGASQPIPLGS